jgi:hypothetical protein
MSCFHIALRQFSLINPHVSSNPWCCQKMFSCGPMTNLGPVWWTSAQNATTCFVCFWLPTWTGVWTNHAKIVKEDSGWRRNFRLGIFMEQLLQYYPLWNWVTGLSIDSYLINWMSIIRMCSHLLKSPSMNYDILTTCIRLGHWGNHHLLGMIFALCNETLYTIQARKYWDPIDSTTKRVVDTKCKLHASRFRLWQK